MIYLPRKERKEGTEPAALDSSPSATRDALPRSAKAVETQPASAMQPRVEDWPGGKAEHGHFLRVLLCAWLCAWLCARP